MNSIEVDQKTCHNDKVIIYDYKLYKLHYVQTGINDYNEVYETCKQFSPQWDNIGSSLGIRRYTLDIIATDSRQSCEDCMSKMLAKQLKRETVEQPCPTWRKLCLVLCSIDRTAAEKIARRHQFDLNKHSGISE